MMVGFKLSVAFSAKLVADTLTLAVPAVRAVAAGIGATLFFPAASGTTASRALAGFFPSTLSPVLEMQ